MNTTMFKSIEREQEQKELLKELEEELTKNTNEQ